MQVGEAEIEEMRGEADRVWPPALATLMKVAHPICIFMLYHVTSPQVTLRYVTLRYFVYVRGLDKAADVR